MKGQRNVIDHSATGKNQRAAALPGTTRKKRVLIVNGYFSEYRLPVRLTGEIPNTTAPQFLAGYLSKDHFEIILHNEVSDGFIEVYRPELLSWPDMVILTGMTACFDRLLHITAYARTANEKVVVVAGGVVIRSFPRYSQRFFDYVCLGEVEEVKEVIAEVYGPDHVAESWEPRYDLASWNRWLHGFAESTRYCNFKCSYCTLTPMDKKHEVLGIDYLRRQILAMGKKHGLVFLDNQFFGPDLEFIDERMELLREMKAAGQINCWTAICTINYLWDRERIRKAHEAGCIALFCGVETFDTDWLRGVKKKQNTVKRSQAELMEACLEEGIIFQYGLMIDPCKRSVASIREELDWICENDRIGTPLYVYSVIPIPGTQVFRERAAEDLFLPNTRIRDLEGSTLTMKSLGPPEEFGAFLRDYRSLYRSKWARHETRFLWRYRKPLNWTQILGYAACGVAFVWPTTVFDLRNLFVRRGSQPQRTHVSTTDRLDCVYTPRLPVAPKYESYFHPTMMTDAKGRLNDELVDDLLGESPLVTLSSKSVA